MYYGRAVIKCKYCELEIVNHPRCITCEILLHENSERFICTHYRCGAQHGLTTDGVHCYEHEHEQSTPLVLTEVIDGIIVKFNA